MNPCSKRTGRSVINLSSSHNVEETAVSGSLTLMTPAPQASRGGEVGTVLPVTQVQAQLASSAGTRVPVTLTLGAAKRRNMRHGPCCWRCAVAAASTDDNG